MNTSLLFANYLVDNGIVSKDKIDEQLKYATNNRTPLYLEMIKTSFMDEKDVYSHLSKFLNVEFRFFQLTEVDFNLIDKFPRDKIIEYQIVPYDENNDEVICALSNPLRMEELKEFAYYCNKKVSFFLIVPSQMDALIRYIDNKIQQNAVLDDFSKNAKDVVDFSTDDASVTIEAPIIKLCDSILKDAISRGASDIHIEPSTEHIIVRYRIDGKLTVIDRISMNLFQSILARFKIMAEMNIAERRVPQDGKINLEINGQKYDFRVSTIPTINGEKLVIRIYNINLASGNISSLGLDANQERIILEMITRPHGIILLTGPTGSGKSTTLYTFLRYLNREDTNIITVEDPVENQITGINQVQVNAKANMTFASALRSILRQDPNIIMIGEIRDEETAQIATRAAITGHLVLSTIHTNDASGVVTRLINMGIPPYLVADSLIGSISQRLVRKLCDECKIKVETTPAEMQMLKIDKPQFIYKPCGCKACNNTGYSGRVGVFEILVCDDLVKNTIMSNNFTSEILNKVAHDKMETIMENAARRVLTGVTSIEEYEQLSEVVEVKNIQR